MFVVFMLCVCCLAIFAALEYVVYSRQALEVSYLSCSSALVEPECPFTGVLFVGVWTVVYVRSFYLHMDVVQYYFGHRSDTISG